MQNSKGLFYQDHLYKIVLVGNSSVGKTCILRRFTDDTFVQSYLATIGIDFKFKTIQITDPLAVAKLQIWDTAGQERYRTITSSYYNSTHGFIVVFDVNNRSSFNDACNYWVEEIKRHTNLDCVVLMIGNKMDCSDIDMEKWGIQTFCQENNIPIVFTSAKSGDGVFQAFSLITKLCIKTFGKTKKQELSPSEIIQQIKQKKAKMKIKTGQQRYNRTCC